MKSQLGMLILLSGLLVGQLARAESGIDYRIQVPKGYKAITSIDELADSLESNSHISRFNAVIRLIELNDSRALPLLERAFEDDPSQDIEDVGPGCGIDYYALFGIGKIGGPEARTYLWKVAETLLSTRVATQPRADTTCQIYGLFQALSFTEPVDSADYFFRIAQNQNFWRSVRITAYRAYIRIFLKDPRFGTFADSLNYMIDELRPTINSESLASDSVFSFAYIKNSAISREIVYNSIDNPEVLRRRESTLSPTDPFYEELKSLVKIVDFNITNKREFLRNLNENK